MLEVLNTIISGQELDLRRFAGSSADRILALRTDAELEDYTYRGAGCVGEFWTKMCRGHVFPQPPLADSFLVANTAPFGKRLQHINILPTFPPHCLHDRCILP